MQQGDARTSLLQEIDQDHSVRPGSNQALALLDQQAKGVNAGGRSVPAVDPAAADASAGLTATGNQRTVECPLSGSVVDMSVSELANW